VSAGQVTRCPQSSPEPEPLGSRTERGRQTRPGRGGSVLSRVSVQSNLCRGRDLHAAPHGRPGLHACHYLERASYNVDPVTHALQAGTARCDGEIEPYAVVLDLEEELVPPPLERDPHARRPGVPDRILQRFGTAEVHRLLDAGRVALNSGAG